MNIFISWSGNKSRAIAEAFRTAVPRIMQSARPFLSTSTDLERGARWPQELGTRLELANAGIFCITAENRDRPWMLFEAGAIAKIQNSVLIPYLNELSKADMTPPLSLFHMAGFGRQEVFEMFVALNRHCSTPLSDERLRDAFGLAWPDLEMALLAARDVPEFETQEPHRSERELLEELLELTRGMTREYFSDAPEPILVDQPYYSRDHPRTSGILRVFDTLEGFEAWLGRAKETSELTPAKASSLSDWLSRRKESDAVISDIGISAGITSRDPKLLRWREQGLWGVLLLPDSF